MLKDAGLVNETQLQAALTDQNRWGGRIGMHLVRMNVLREADLVSFLSRQLGVPHIDFRRSPVQKLALRVLGRDQCEKWNVIPVAYKESRGHKRIMLAMADPTDMEAISAIEFLTGCSVKPVVGLENEIQTAIGYCYSADGLRGSDGLSDVLDQAKIQPSVTGEATVIISDGEEHVYDPDALLAENTGLKALLEILYEKKVLTPEEFHRKMDQLERAGSGDK